MSRVFGQLSPEKQLDSFGERLGFDPQSINPDTRRLLLNAITDADAGALFLEGKEDLINYIQTRANPRNVYESDSAAGLVARTVVSATAITSGISMRLTEQLVGPLLDAMGHLPKNK